MDRKTAAKKLLLVLLKEFERLHLENLALKAMLKTSGHRDITDNWEKHLKEFVSDPELQAQCHAKFAPLYAQIERAADEAAALELLSKFPTTGSIN
jgi:hypothetical protein